MRFSLTVVDGVSGARRDVLLDADPNDAVADVLPALSGIAAADPMHEGFARRSAVWVDGRRVDNAESLRSAGVRAGARVALHEPDDAVAGLPAGVVELRVVSGSGAGRVQRLGIGEHVVGNGALGLSLPDLMLPADALTVRVTPSAQVEIVSCRVEGVRVDGRDPHEPDPESDSAYDNETDDLPDEALTRRQRTKARRARKRAARAAVKAAERAANGPTSTVGDEAIVWPEGADLRLAGTLVQWHRVWQPDADATASEDVLGIDFNRPPRLLPPAPERSFLIPDEPRKPRKIQLPWPMVLAPMVMAGPMALVFGSYRFLLFALMSPIMALFNLVASRRGSARDYREKIVEFRLDDRSVRQRIARALRAERDEQRAIHPDPADLLLQVVGPGQRLWCRRRTDPDYLALRLGVADRPSQISVRERGRKETEEPRPADVVGDVPVALSMRDLGVVGAYGDPGSVDSMARWMLGQAAALHTPRDLQVVVLTRSDREEQWGWLRWLPHCRREGEPIGALIGLDQETSARRVGELLHLVNLRAEDATPAYQQKLPPGPEVLVVLDGARRLRSLPGIVTLLRQGPAVGVHVLCLDDEVGALPEECRAVLAVGEGVVELRRAESEAVARIRPDLVEPAWAERLARSLAPVRDTTPDVSSSSLPSSARLLECIGLENPTGPLVAARWGPAAQTDVVIGAGFDGNFRLDLRRDGPHALVAGTTGSGKSELLQTIVASLAVSNSPDQLTFVLVDYKGGSAFKDCAQLPHTVGMVTDLDTHLVGRALTSLGAELRRREHLLAGPGAKDLEDYWALQRNDPSLPTIPRLALVIDEFASLKAELPDFVTGLVTIAQRGRSLGIHLVLATQRPSGVISADIRANTNLRIALRVTDESESKDVIDASDSATIGPDQPGRGYARLGHSSLLPFQSGRVGGARPRTSAVATAGPAPLAWPLPWDRIGNPTPVRAVEESAQTDEGETDLSVLVTAVREATRLRGLPQPHSPWLPALPTPVTLDELRTRVGDLPPATAVWALEDHPAEQAQEPRLFTLGKSGHLYIVGGPRSGRSTALRTLAVGLAEASPSRDLHLYGLDCGNGALLPLTSLPHTGAIVQRTESERAGRLLDRLADEARRRQQVLGASGFADVDEQRAAAAPDDRLPYVVLLVDRWEGFVADLAEIDMGRLNDQVFSLLREGASVGIHVVMSGDRSLLGGRVATLVEHKLLLRLPDRSDYSTAGLRPKDVPDNLADGRGLWAEVGTEAQVAVLGSDVSGAAQSSYVRETGHRLTRAERDLGPVPAALRPTGLAVVPAEADAATVLDEHAAVVPTGHVPLAIGGDRLDLLCVEAVTAPVLVVGPPRSGRTTTLGFVASWAERSGLQVLAFTPNANALSERLGDAAVVGLEHDPQDIVTRLKALPDGSVLLVDDGEALREGPLAGLLLAIVRQARDRGFSMVVAGGLSEMSAGFSGWIAEARKGRRGLLLSPQETLQGDIFGGRVTRTSLVSRVTPGRGALFAGEGDQVLVQVPH